MSLSRLQLARHPAGVLLASLLLALGLIGLLDRYTRPQLPEPLLTPLAVERWTGAAPGDLAMPAADAPGWQPVSLPERAPLQAGERRQRAWYRLRFVTGQVPDRLQALLLQRPLAALRVHVDGELLADSGVERRPLPLYRHDLRYNLSPAWWRDGRIEVLVLAVSEQGSAGLGQVLVGDSLALARYKAGRNRIEKRSVQLSVQASLILATVLLVFWLVRRQERAFAWLAAALLGRALFTTLGIQQTPWFDWPELSRSLIYLALLGFILCELMFSRSLLRIPDRGTERALTALFGAIALILLGLSLGRHPGYVAFAIFVAVPAALATGALIVARFAGHALRHPDSTEVRWLLFLAGVLLAVGLRDWLHDLRLIGAYGSGRYQHFATPFAFAVFGAMLLRRHLQALAAVEAMNRELEAKVQAKTEQIARSWRHIATIERERARFEERDRMLREMHDGVGGHLVQALALVSARQDPVRIGESVQAALDDLRLLIDASDVHAESLGELLARFRARIQRRLLALDVRLDWDLTTWPELPALDGEHSMQVLRILQELITNAIRHGRPSTIAVECQRIRDPEAAHADQLLFELRDDGQGFDPALGENGRGLVNLRHRVGLLGGYWHLDSRPGHGTRVRFGFPLGSDEPGPAGPGPLAA